MVAKMRQVYFEFSQPLFWDLFGSKCLLVYSFQLSETNKWVSFSVEREHVQKTFTKWVNSHLCRVNCRVVDLYTDLRDGKLLIKLLEILSGERLVRTKTKL
jgi:hypothetical protein